MTEHRLYISTPEQSGLRRVEDVARMAIVTQANVAQLRTAEARHRGFEPDAHEIQTPSPGPVTAFREALIDHRRIAAYGDADLHLRLHEIWGQHCLFCWSLNAKDPQSPPSFGSLAPDHAMQCFTAIQIKEAEIEALFWRHKIEQEVRREPDRRMSPENQARWRFASRIPAKAFGQDVHECDDQALLISSCEHAGMLAAVRWILDRRMMWGSPELMAVDEASMFGEEAGGD